MSRGGRGGQRGARGGGGRKAGPETEDWDPELDEKQKWKPEKTFPNVEHRDLPVPLSESERNRFTHYCRFREAVHDGPLYAMLDTNLLTDEKGKLNKRAGVNPFESMPTYSEIKYKKARRTLPDLTTRPYVLKYFPRELWSTLDPKRKGPEWKSLPSKDGKRPESSPLAGSSNTDTLGKRVYESEHDEDEEEQDVVAAGRKKRRKREKDDPTNQGQKKGLEAEDEYGPEPEDADLDEEDADDAENVDTDFSESDDGAGDDYDAEQYFETGENDDIEDGGGDNDDGVF